MNSIDKKHTWARFCSWVANHRKLLIIIGSIVVLLTAAALTYFFVFYKPTPTQPKPETQLPKVEPIKYYSPLTGTLVESESLTKRPVTGIMIENSPEARPQSGLKNSGVVFEAIAEGGITRFLALYQTEQPQLIGPVRSVRSYYVDWLAAFNASIAHIGGSAAALNEVRNGKYRDIDQFFNDNTYWRSTDRFAPHNVYTSFAKIDALNTSLGYTSSTFDSFRRIDGKAAQTQNAKSINMSISTSLFNSSYIYDPTNNTYARYQAGAAHLDREGGQITPSVVIALLVDEQTMMEDGYRQNIKTIGSGRAVIFQNGTATEGIWSKSSPTSQIKFTDTTGVEILLIRGQTWITAIPNGSGDVTWQ
ncbi:MAG: DUF3048 domain-containing protein [Candidatus Saccharibacteria bacterium]